MQRDNLPASASIKFLSGPLEGQTFSIQKPDTTIGREITNDIVVKSDAKVSRQHARLLWQGGEWSIEKLSQSSFLTVNQQKVQQAPIGNNTIIGLGGDTSFVFLTSVEDDIHRVSQSSAEDTTYRIAPSSSATPPSFGQNEPPASSAYSALASQQQATPSPFTPPQPLQSQQPPPQYDVTAQLGERSARLDATQIASYGAIGLPSIEISSYAHSDKKTYALTKPVINIGRDVTNDIIINDRIVSGVHLRIVRQGNAFVLIHPHPDRPTMANASRPSLCRSCA